MKGFYGCKFRCRWQRRTFFVFFHPGHTCELEADCWHVYWQKFLFSLQIFNNENSGWKQLLHDRVCSNLIDSCWELQSPPLLPVSKDVYCHSGWKTLCFKGNCQDKISVLTIDHLETFFSGRVLGTFLLTILEEWKLLVMKCLIVTNKDNVSLAWRASLWNPFCSRHSWRSFFLHTQNKTSNLQVSTPHSNENTKVKVYE